MIVSFRLAIAYLKKQKGRTLSLIISIVLAVMLVFTLNVVPESKSKHDIKEAYKNFSDYHVEYSDLNLEIVDKLKKDKTIKVINDVINLGNVVSNKGVSMSLNSYSKDFIDSYGYTLIKGSEPKNENEIVIEEKALKEMGLGDKLGQSIDFNIIKNYTDENSKNQIYSKEKSFKLVGILKKPDGFYDGNLYYKVKAFTKYTGNQSILPKELISHSGILKFTTNMYMADKAIAKYKLDDEKFRINVQLNEAIQNYDMSKDSKSKINNKLIPMVAATLVIYNIFNIILIDMKKQIGMVRAIGMTKKNVRYMVCIQSFIVLLIGLAVGFLMGILASYAGLRSIYNEHISVYISKESIIEPMCMAVVSVAIASIFTIYNCGNISPIEAIRSTGSLKSIKKDRFYHKLIRKVFGLTGYMEYKNIWRYKTRTILSILSISITGFLFITNMVAFKQYDKNVDSLSPIIMEMGESDIILSHNSNNSSEYFNEYTDDEVSKISKIDGVSELTKNMNTIGYLNSNKENISDYYKQNNPLDSDESNLEIGTSIKGYDKSTLKKLEKYLEDKNIDNLKKEGDTISAIVSNHFYSGSAVSNDSTTLKELKVGDIIEVKIPETNGKEVKYVNQKIKVAGLLNTDYVLNAECGMDSRFQVILDKNSFENLTGKKGFNNISIKLQKEKEEGVVSKVKEIINEDDFKEMESKYENRKISTEGNIKLKKEVLVSVIITLVISSINIACIVITNIMIRLKEISTLRAIGMSMKNVKKMILKESIIYGILSSIIAGVFSSYNTYKSMQRANEIFSQGAGIKQAYEFKIPEVEILQFGVGAIIICVIAGYLAKNKVSKLSIVEGLKNEE
ncbi:ABC transporter permease [Paraclostridium ghonii]|uniref:ABC transport system permease protein n=1 Tax=Paraclostridium ghonii TaxID=29358 RepID=A0ABU0MXJ9_9FIRM|nr:FtsX-like permease family protein [Paeniclostridium ghonii]MDQ0555630.1 putative ABC transport system permease protein [Paeniclostridium ghonii]